MKNIYYRIQKIVVITMVGSLIFSCDKRLDELYDNPNSVTKVDDAALFANAARSVFLGTADNAAYGYAGMYAHYYVAGDLSRFPDQYGDGFDGDYNSILSDGYSGTIKHIEEVLQITTTEGTTNNVRNAMANVIAVLGYAKITDGFGDVPYTEGGKGKTSDILQPKYDTQESIYKDLIVRLTASISVLKSADASLGYPNSDPIFANDLSKWVRFANSIKLRLAMRLRYADNALSKATVTECLAQPLMETNEHDAFMIQTEGTGNAWFNRRTAPTVKMSTRLISQLKSTEDPRLEVFVDPDGNGEFSGITNGLNDQAFGTANFSSKSNMGITLSSADSKLYVITASEVWLLRAEAALVYDNDPAMANTYYQNGIRASLSQWGIDAAAIDTFMGSATATLGGENDEEQIGEQMWLALTPNYFESWNYIRRTGYPVIAERTAAELSRGATNGIMPNRFLYSTFEIGSNTTNVNEAIARQGANKIDTPVWWDKN